MKLPYLLFIFLFQSCHLHEKIYDYPFLPLLPTITKNNLSDAQKINDPVIDLYQNEFLDLAASYNYPILQKPVYSVKKDLRGNGWSILGQCLVYDDANLIVVDSSFWASASDFNRRSLVYHELGHCLLGRAHRTIYYQGMNRNYAFGISPNWDFLTHPGWPLSLMNDSLVKENSFRPEFDYYIRELFDEGNGEMRSETNYNCSFN